MTTAHPTVLLTEDEWLVALSISEELELAGFEVAGPFARCSDAETWLKDARPDCAVLDLRLQDGDCTALAAEVSRRGIPIVILSGFQRRTCPVQIGASAWLEKPPYPGAVGAAVHAVLDQALAGRADAGAQPRRSRPQGALRSPA
jgi:DNA-binding response OmpR family regulator